jgi:hypothetical protein
MIWTFSDGTTVELGGNVEGPTLLAQRIRVGLADEPHVSIWPPPESGSRPLDPNDPALLEAWLRSELDLWTRIRGLKLSLSSPSGIPSLPPPPWADQPSEPGAIY